MNIVLFEAEEISTPIARKDERAVHILEVLRRNEGDSFDAGIINDRKGKAIVRKISEDTLQFEFAVGSEDEPPPYPIDLIVGLSRPQTNRKILQEATALGVRSIRFIHTERGEPSYATSRLWSTGEWRRHVLSGVAQAFTTKLPEIFYGLSLKEAMEQLKDSKRRLALDNYQGERRLSSADGTRFPIVLAVGSERGWTQAERDRLGASGYELAHLGTRPLRTETATVSGVALLLAGMAL